MRRPRFYQKVLDRIRKRKKHSRHDRRHSFEQLELRQLLSADVSNLHLVNDTGTPNDSITSDPRVTGTVTGSFYGGSAKVEFDHNADGTADGNSTASYPSQSITYDPRTTDPPFGNL